MKPLLTKVYQICSIGDRPIWDKCTQLHSKLHCALLFCLCLLSSNARHDMLWKPLLFLLSIASVLGSLIDITVSKYGLPTKTGWSHGMKTMKQPANNASKTTQMVCSSLDLVLTLWGLHTQLQYVDEVLHGPIYCLLVADDMNFLTISHTLVISKVIARGVFWVGYAASKGRICVVAHLCR